MNRAEILGFAVLAQVAACREVRRQPQVEPSREMNTMPSPSFSIACAGQRPSKPPRRAFSCSVRLVGWAAPSGWLLLPASLDRPLARTSSLDALELVRTAGGQEYLRGHGDPGFVAIRLPEEGPVLIEGWEFSTFQDRVQVEAWLVEDVRIGASTSLRDLLASAAPDVAPTGGPALLQRWPMGEGSDASLGEPIVLQAAIAVP